MAVPITGSDLWPEALDAMTAAPEYHSVILENDQVRVLDIHVPPGQRTPVHTHEWPCVLHILSWSDFIRRDADEAVLVDTRRPGFNHPPAIGWALPLAPHSFENVGAAAFHAIGVELKPGTN